jgi:hypothetical protein
MEGEQHGKSCLCVGAPSSAACAWCSCFAAPPGASPRHPRRAHPHRSVSALKPVRSFSRDEACEEVKTVDGFQGSEKEVRRRAAVQSPS